MVNFDGYVYMYKHAKNLGPKKLVSICFSWVRFILLNIKIKVYIPW